jgi:hypothetical protein
VYHLTQNKSCVQKLKQGMCTFHTGICVVKKRKRKYHLNWMELKPGLVGWQPKYAYHCNLLYNNQRLEKTIIKITRIRR